MGRRRFNINGLLILTEMKRLGQPATAHVIVKNISKRIGMITKEFKQNMKSTLDGGVRFGYLDRHKGKYFHNVMLYDRQLVKELVRRAVGPNAGMNTMKRALEKRKSAPILQRQRKHKRNRSKLLIGQRYQRKSKKSLNWRSNRQIMQWLSSSRWNLASSRISLLPKKRKVLRTPLKRAPSTRLIRPVKGMVARAKLRPKKFASPMKSDFSTKLNRSKVTSAVRFLPASRLTPACKLRSTTKLRSVTTLRRRNKLRSTTKPKLCRPLKSTLRRR